MASKTDMIMEMLKTQRDEMNIGFKGVHKRLDTLNGTVRSHDIKIAQIKEREKKPFKGGGLTGLVVRSIVNVFGR